jgi:hypothetical protein
MIHEPKTEVNSAGRRYTKTEMRKDVMTPKKHTTARTRKRLKKVLYHAKKNAQAVI